MIKKPQIAVIPMSDVSIDEGDFVAAGYRFNSNHMWYFDLVTERLCL